MLTLIYISSPFTDVHIFFKGSSATWRLYNLWAIALCHYITYAHWFDLCVTCIHVNSCNTVTLSQLVGMIYAHFHRVQYLNTACCSESHVPQPLSTSLNSFQLSSPLGHVTMNQPQMCFWSQIVLRTTQRTHPAANVKRPPAPNPSPFVSLCE